MSGRVHSRELKLTIVRQLASGEKRPAQICREHNLASSVVSRWRNEYDQRAEEAFLPKASSEAPSAEAKIAELERFCGQLALENALLKKRPCRYATPMMMKIGYTAQQREALRSRPRQWSTKPDKKAG